MPLSWNEIRDRSTAFVHEWADESRERAEAQTFWNEFFQVFGITRRRVAAFESYVRKLEDEHGYIDCFWPGTLIAEHKSRGRDLDSAYVQAIDYFANIRERDLPRYVVVSDFATIRLYDLDDNTQTEFPLRELPKRIKSFGFIAGYRPQVLRAEDPVNVKAAERMGKLHDALKETGYEGHKLEVLLVRLLFCLFAEDTGIFQPAQAFRMWLEERTAEDGSDLGSQLAHAFQILNTPYAERSGSLDEQLAAFPYVNGRLFTESLPIAAFDAGMRNALLEACALDWSQISPAVFGAMFQSIMDKDARRDLGAHYTSEQNIEKLIKPLFLDGLHEEFERVKTHRNKLFEFHKKLRSLTFLDPACGCGNFLVVTYRAIRELELDVMRASRDLYDPGSDQLFDVHSFINVDVDQFYGIEIEEFPARIAEVALWLTDHQMNVKVSEEFGRYFARIPLVSTPHIYNENALRMDWDTVVPRTRLNYILGNPPFGGKRYQSPEQKAGIHTVLGRIKGHGVLDFVAGWYIKAVQMMGDRTGLVGLDRRVSGRHIRCGFVSTNSITQGEQVSVIWPEMLSYGTKIFFAHRTFRWSNEARNKAAVHCVIIGFGVTDRKNKTIFDYDEAGGEPHARAAQNINPYLVDAPDVVITNRRQPICDVPTISFGSMPNDGGHFLLNESEYYDMNQREPAASEWIRPFMGSREFINGTKRWCFWLVGIRSRDLSALPLIKQRVQCVKELRENSTRDATRQLARVPTQFGEIRQPDTEYLAIPKTSSEMRQYIPIALVSSDVIASTELFTLADANLYHFGVLTSTMKMAWTRYTCGRLKSDLRYSAGLVYNNFPWPQKVSGDRRKKIEGAAQNVLDVRAGFTEFSLADLYNPLTMPVPLLKAHRELDRAVDAAYSRRRFSGDADRVAFLFEQYQKLTELPDASGTGAKGRKSSGSE